MLSFVILYQIEWEKAHAGEFREFCFHNEYQFWKRNTNFLESTEGQQFMFVGNIFFFFLEIQLNTFYHYFSAPMITLLQLK